MLTVVTTDWNEKKNELVKYLTDEVIVLLDDEIEFKTPDGKKTIKNSKICLIRESTIYDLMQG